jgi:hypothetical protein
LLLDFQRRGMIGSRGRVGVSHRRFGSCAE